MSRSLMKRARVKYVFITIWTWRWWFIVFISGFYDRNMLVLALSTSNIHQKGHICFLDESPFILHFFLIKISNFSSKLKNSTIFTQKMSYNHIKSTIIPFLFWSFKSNEKMRLFCHYYARKISLSCSNRKKTHISQSITLELMLTVWKKLARMRIINTIDSKSS